VIQIFLESVNPVSTAPWDQYGILQNWVSYSCIELVMVDKDGVNGASGSVGMYVFQDLENFLRALFHTEVAESKPSFGMWGIYSCSWKCAWIAHFCEACSDGAALCFV